MVKIIYQTIDGRWHEMTVPEADAQVTRPAGCQGAHGALKHVGKPASRLQALRNRQRTKPILLVS